MRAAAMVALAVAATGLAAAPTGDTGAGPGPSVVYLVQTTGRPAGDPRVTGRLHKRQDEVAARAGVRPAQFVHRYAAAFPGFAARLTAAQAATLARTPGVVAVTRDEQRAGLSITTPEFLGLTGDTGAWQRYGGGAARAGENAIVGFIDSGLAFEHPSFAALPEPRPDAAAIAARWRGGCDDPQWCSNKVIGARAFRAGAVDVSPAEFDSPRDFNGHGTHIGAVAAGDHGVPAVVGGVSAGNTSGVAPAARIAVYKALWQTTSGRLVGSTSDLVAAIDQATADGVDVLNYSAAGASGTVTDPVNVALYHAAAAGVFIAAAAGNDGPTGAVGSIAPWVTTVAAGTHDRVLTRTLRLGDGTFLTGAGQGSAALPAGTRIVDPTRGATVPADAELCKAGALSRTVVEGAIVLCKRGVTGRTDKSRAVRDAGGVGVVLYNDPDSTLDTDFHPVPTVHLNRADGLRVKAYAATAGATAQLDAAVRGRVTAPAVAATSSAGPARVPHSPVLKPDLLAPGAGVLAATAASGTPTFDLRSGSSVAAAQVSGAGALLLGRTPSLTPAAVRSALMTTAGVTDAAGSPIKRGAQAATPLDFGAGHLRPTASFDPGLVFESTPANWLSFVCATEPAGAAAFAASGCTGVPAVQARDLNQPALSDSAVAHSVSFRRVVSNPTNQAGVYFPTVTAPLGYTVSVTPSALTVLPRRTAAVTVTVTRDDAVPDRWEFGEVKLADIRGHAVRLPVAVRAVRIDAPERIRVSGTSGTAAVPVVSGFNGTLHARTLGPVPVQRGSVPLDPRGPAFNPSAPTAGSRTAATDVTVPDGGLVRFATRAADHPAGTDVDLYVYRRTATGLTLTGVGNNVGSDEEVVVDQPGEYRVFHHLYAATAPTSVVRLSWPLSVPADGLTVGPASSAVTAGAAVSLTLTWQGLEPAQEYLGVLLLDDGVTGARRTFVTIGT